MLAVIAGEYAGALAFMSSPAPMPAAAPTAPASPACASRPAPAGATPADGDDANGGDTGDALPTTPLPLAWKESYKLRRASSRPIESAMTNVRYK